VVTTVHDVSVVVPVYRGELTLPDLVERLGKLNHTTTTPRGTAFRVDEVLLVFDWGPDRSDEVMRGLATEYEFVRCVWLMRNVGQHAATAAGIASSGGQWVATLDEDGQHDPAQLGAMLDVAIERDAHLVYGVNIGGTPHPWWRNATSACAKSFARAVCGTSLDHFTSFRLIEGSRARAACAYLGARTFLDVALTWTVARTATCQVHPGVEGRAGSGYRLGSLLSHFWTLVLSSGTRPLRIISVLGLVAALSGLFAGVLVMYYKFQHGYDTQGWASVFIAVVVMGGAVLFALGVVAEYIGATLKTVQGRPAFVIGEDPRLVLPEPDQV
jgi:undecaprenyl-phosphate 4-deoxy-4-formamido-L-arabinose transferase